MAHNFSTFFSHFRSVCLHRHNKIRCKGYRRYVDRLCDDDIFGESWLMAFFNSHRVFPFSTIDRNWQSHRKIGQLSRQTVGEAQQEGGERHS